MTDHWTSWPEDRYDGPHDDGFTEASEPAGEHDPGYPTDEPVEGFGAADEPVEGFGAADEPGAVAGFGAADPSWSEPAGHLTPDPYASDGDPYDAESAADPDPYGADWSAGGEPATEGFGAADPPIGADPDRNPYGDAAGWPESTGPDEWPPPGLGPAPEPVDGFPWADPGLLGDPAAGPVPGSATDGLPAPAADELADYAGLRLPADGDPWSALAAAEDPATSALARFWAPPRH